MIDITPQEHAALDVERTQYIKARVLPAVRYCFEHQPWLQSITLLVAQYYNDQASDAVHGRFVSSQLDRPDLEAYFDAQERWDPDHLGDVNVPPGEEGLICTWDWRKPYSVPWDSDETAIPLFAAYCPEGSHQDRSACLNYRPYAIFRRGRGKTPQVEVVGVQIRPWVDGIPADGDE